MPAWFTHNGPRRRTCVFRNELDRLGLGLSQFPTKHGNDHFRDRSQYAMVQKTHRIPAGNLRPDLVLLHLVGTGKPCWLLIEVKGGTPTNRRLRARRSIRSPRVPSRICLRIIRYATTVRPKACMGCRPRTRQRERDHALFARSNTNGACCIVWVTSQDIRWGVALRRRNCAP
jgi:hypothetical protein